MKTSVAWRHPNRVLIGQGLLSAVRILLGVLLVAAAVSKVSHQAQFVNTVLSYDLLPRSLGEFYAIMLPWAELVVGCCLVAGLFTRFVSAVSIPLIITFIIANSYGLLIGDKGPCGCYGNMVDIGHSGALLVDIAMLAMATASSVLRPSVFSLDSQMTSKSPGSRKGRPFGFDGAARIAAIATVFLITMQLLLPLIGQISAHAAGSPRTINPSKFATASFSTTPGYCGSSGGSLAYESIASVECEPNASGTLAITVDIYIANPTGCTYGSECPEYNNSPEYVNAWVDWNGDKVFGGDEKVIDAALTGYLNINYHGTMTTSGLVTIPKGSVKSTWMRVNLGWGYDPNDPCDAGWTWGDVFDKEVTIGTEMEIKDGLAQYKADELKEKVFRRGDDKPRFEIKAPAGDGQTVKVDIFKGGSSPIKTLNAVHKSGNTYEAVWSDWSSSSWPQIPDGIPVGTYQAKATVMKGGTQVSSSDMEEFYVIFNYTLKDMFVESPNVWRVNLETTPPGVAGSYPVSQYDQANFATSLSRVDGSTDVVQAGAILTAYVGSVSGSGCDCACRTRRMTELCRSVGIPARYVAAHGEWNDGDGIPTYANEAVFRHAFTEIRNANGQWIHFDDQSGWGSSAQVGADVYAVIGVEFRPDVPGVYGYWVGAATGLTTTGISGAENAYDRYTFCADVTEIKFLNGPYDYGQTMRYSVTIRNSGSIAVDTPVYVRIFDVPSILTLGVAHKIEDTEVAKSLAPGASVTTTFTGTLPDYGSLNSFYEQIGEREIKAVAYYKASNAGNVEIETDVLSAKIPGLCLSMEQSVLVDGQQRDLVDPAVTHLGETPEGDWIWEKYFLDVPAEVTTYAETQTGEDYSRAVVSVANPDSAQHAYSVFLQLAGAGDAVYVPSVGNITDNTTGLNVSVNHFVTYSQSEGSAGKVTVHRFSRNATITDIEFIEYEGARGVLVDAMWDESLGGRTLREFSIYSSDRPTNGLAIEDIGDAFAEEIVSNGDSLLGVQVAPAEWRVGETSALEITLVNNGAVDESVTLAVDITRTFDDSSGDSMSLYSGTLNASVAAQSQRTLEVTIPMTQYTMSGLWDVNVTSNKGIAAGTVALIEDAFTLDCTEGAEVEEGSSLLFDATVTNTWGSTVHGVDVTLDLGGYFDTTDAVEVPLGDLAAGQSIALSWEIAAATAGVLPVRVHVSSEDGGWDEIGTTIVSLSSPALWIVTPSETTTAPDVGGTKAIPITFDLWNVGDTAASNVQVSLSLPDGVSASENSWDVATLSGGEETAFSFDLSFSGSQDLFIDVVCSDDAGHTASGMIWVDVVSQFGGSFSDTYSDSAQDTDGDGSYDQLVVGVGVNVITGGGCEVEGWLYDGSGGTIGRASASPDLAAGPQTVNLSIDGAAISEHGVDGPYRLGDLRLYDGNGTLLDSRTDGYTTAPYSAGDFEKPLVALTGQYSDHGLDSDGNGLYEELVVEVGVILGSEGNCVVQARLMDGDGTEIAWASNTVWLDANQELFVPLAFDGLTINKNGANGPYYLKDLFVYHTGDPLLSVYEADAYTTAAYGCTAFESILVTELPKVRLAHADPGITAITVTGLDLAAVDETYKPGDVSARHAFTVEATGTGSFALLFTDIAGASAMQAFKIDPASDPPNQWMLLDSVTTGDTVTVTMEAGDPPVVLASSNESPSADAGPDQVVEQTSLAGAEATLNGSGSSDPDGDALTYVWTWAGGSANGETVVAVFPVGTTIVTLEVSDGVLSDTDEVSITVQDTTTPPAPTLSSPLDGATTNDSTVDLDWSDVSDVSEPVLYQVQVDNDSDFLSAEYDSDWISLSNATTSVLPDSTYNWRARAKDNIGNVGDWSTVWQFMIDTTPPSVAMVNPPSGYDLQDGVTFVASATDGGSGVNAVTFSIREDDGSDGTPVGFEDIPATYDSGTGKWTLWFDTLQLPDGYYVVLVEATDGAGNVGSITVPYSIRNGAALTTTVIGKGCVSRDPDQAIYTYGTGVTLSAKAAPGWTFVGWSGDLSGNTNPVVITMDGNKVITATFAVKTKTLLCSAPNPSGYGQRVTFVALVLPMTWCPGMPTGTVTFKDAGVTLGTGTLNACGLATFSTSSLSVGKHSITATYEGGVKFNGSTSSALSQKVKACTTVKVVSSTNPSVYRQSVTFTATVVAKEPGAGVPTGKVTFKDGWRTLGTGTLDATGHATYSTSSLSVGVHSITAVYGGDDNFCWSTSSVLCQNVKRR
jgi:uncharacterized repeat protein (TIGR02543 family)